VWHPRRPGLQRTPLWEPQVSQTTSRNLTNWPCPSSLFRWFLSQVNISYKMYKSVPKFCSWA
jgi:hypothetical protein